MGKRLASYLNQKKVRFKMLSVGFTDFKNNFNKWMPGGEMNTFNIGSYLEGAIVDGGGGDLTVPPPLPLGK